MAAQRRSSWEKRCLSEGIDSLIRWFSIQWLLRWFIDSIVHWFTDSLIHWFIDSLYSWFIDSLISWAIGSLIQWFVESLIRWFNAWFTDSLVHWFMASPIYWFTRSLIHWFIALLLRWFIASLINWLIGSSSDSLIRCLFPSSIYWFIDSMPHWLMVIGSLIHGFFHAISLSSQQRFAHSLMHLTTLTLRCFCIPKTFYRPSSSYSCFIFSKFMFRRVPGSMWYVYFLIRIYLVTIVYIYIYQSNVINIYLMFFLWINKTIWPTKVHLQA